jgi:protein ImuA
MKFSNSQATPNTIVAPNVTASMLAKPLSHPKVFRIGDIPSPDRARSLPTGFTALDRELVGGGWPQQGLVELLSDDTGIGELSLMLPAHAYLSNARHLGSTGMLWVTSTTWPYLPYAPALAQAGLNLNQLVIAKAPHMPDAVWTAEQGLLSGSIGIVTVWLPDQQPLDVSLRRLSQAAHNSNALCILMRPIIAANRPSPAQLRIVLKAAAQSSQTHGVRSALELNLIKRRGLPMGKTIVLETRSLACLQREQTAQHRHIPNPARGWLERLITAAPVASVPANIRQRSFEIDR